MLNDNNGPHGGPCVKTTENSIVRKLELETTVRITQNKLVAQLSEVMTHLEWLEVTSKGIVEHNSAGQKVNEQEGRRR